MATGKATFLENKILDYVTITGTTFTQPANLFFALSTMSLSPGGGNFTEVTGGNYARASLGTNSTNFPAASGGAKSNGAIIGFNQASASWGTIISVAIFDALTSGNMYWFGDLQTSKAVNTNDTPQFAIGALTIQEV